MGGCFGGHDDGAGEGDSRRAPYSSCLLARRLNRSIESSWSSSKASVLEGQAEEDPVTDDAIMSGARGIWARRSRGGSALGLLVLALTRRAG